MKTEKRLKMKICLNILTFSRIFGSLIMLYLYNNYNPLITAVFASIFFATDFVDGLIARKFNISSFLGSILDSICDKIIGIISFLILGKINSLFYIPIFLEIIIILINFLAYKKGNNIQSSKIGKIKTSLMMTSIVLVILLSLFKFNLLILIILSMIIIMQLLVAIDYLKKLKCNKKTVVLKSKKVLKNLGEIKRDIISTEFYLKHKNDGVRELFYKEIK